MIEKINFGNIIWGYVLLAIILGSGIILISLFCRWFYTLSMPSKHILKKRNRILLFLLIVWPLLIVCGGIWAAYKIGYCYFYSLRIEPGEGVVAEYLWPKDEVSIPSSEIESISVVHIGSKWRGSDVLVITTKNGQILRSTAPVPDPEVLPNRIRVALEIPNDDSLFFDSEKAEQAKVVLRIRLIEAGEGSKYLWPKVEIIDVIKNETDAEFKGDIRVGHYSFGAGLPPGVSTIYLTSYNPSSSEENLWRLIEVVTPETVVPGYAHHVNEK